jgi:hypothetical protein
MAEAAALSFLAPAARSLAPQVTALPPLAAYHDLRWLFAFNQSWLGFTTVFVLLLVTRAAVDAVLVQLAWPREPGDSVADKPHTAETTNALGLPKIPNVSRPRFLASAVSCAVLTLLVGLVLSPVVTLMFGVALVPFSWPYLAAVPILLGTAVALSQGGVGQAWWRHLPPVRTAAWVIATFLVLSLASVLMTHLDTPGIVAVAGLAGVVNARAWYGLTSAAVRRSVARPPHPWHWRASLQRIRWALDQRTSWVPVAPLAAVMVIALVVGLTRLAFTGTVHFGPSRVAAGEVLDDGGLAASIASSQPGMPSVPSTLSTAVGQPGSKAHGAVLVVEGFGSSCCHDADALRAAEPGMLVQQFSYLGLSAAGQPISYGPAAGDLPIQVLGDRMATQVEKLYRQVRTPVDIVAESEGTLGLYAMLARHPHVPVGSLALLSPIIEPGQVGQAYGTVPGAALLTLNNLVAGMSPYGSSGAQALIDSVSQVAASYFAMISRDRSLPWLAVVPLADAVTLPACPWPQNVIFVNAFHGGLLGDASVRQMVEAFFSDGRVAATGRVGASQPQLRTAAQLIAAAATAWRMPELHPACPG